MGESTHHLDAVVESSVEPVDDVVSMSPCPILIGKITVDRHLHCVTTDRSFLMGNFLLSLTLIILNRKDCSKPNR